jgi:hypothetical protein
MSNGSREDLEGAAEAEQALVVAEARLAAMSAAGDAASWESLRRELEQAVAISGRTLEAALRHAGMHDLAALEFRLAAVVRALEAARPPVSVGEVALEAELVAAILRKPEGTAHDGHARKEQAIDALLRRLGIADSRALVARIAQRSPGDVLASAFHTLTTDRRERLVATLQGAARREVQAGEAARRAALAAGKSAAVFATPKPKTRP